MFVIVGHASSLGAQDADGRALRAVLPGLPAGSRLVLLGAEGLDAETPLELPHGVERIDLVAALDNQPASGTRRYPGPPVVSGLQEGWQALQLLHCLQRLEREVGTLTRIELPCLGAAGFWLLQERALRQAFTSATIAVRLTAQTSLEAARKGQPLTTSDLIRCDMERRCLVDCDQVHADNAAIAASVARSLGLDTTAWEARLQLPVYDDVAAPIRAGAALGLACIVTETAALRQFVRAAIGILGATTVTPADKVLLATTGIDDALEQVPAAWRPHFGVATLDQILDSGGPATVVFADRWSASADLVRALAGQGRRCIVNALNPAHDEAAGWRDGISALAYADTARALADALRRSTRWAPTTFPQAVAPVAGVRAVAAAATSSPHTAPLVSVLVPYFNLAAYLPETLTNLRAGNYPHLDIVVVDDGSTDPASIQLIDTLQQSPPPGVRVCRLPFNQGLAAARNVGLAAAAGKYVLTLDADDLIAPTFIGEAVAALERLPQVDFVVPQAAYFDDVPNAGRFEDIPFQHCIALIGEAWQSGLYANRYSTATCLGRRDVMRGLGYDEALRAYEDWDFYRRALVQGSRFLVTSEVNFLYRKRPDSMIHAPQMRRRHAQLVAEMGTRGVLTGETLTLTAQTLQLVAAPAGVGGGGHQGLLLADVQATLDEVARLRGSRIVGTAYRLSAAVRALRARLGRRGT